MKKFAKFQNSLLNLSKKDQIKLTMSKSGELVQTKSKAFPGLPPNAAPAPGASCS
jgi:hypothetical protein